MTPSFMGAGSSDSDWSRASIPRGVGRRESPVYSAHREREPPGATPWAPRDARAVSPAHGASRGPPERSRSVKITDVTVKRYSVSRDARAYAGDIQIVEIHTDAGATGL